MTCSVRSRSVLAVLLALVCLAMQTPRTDNIDRLVQTDSPFTPVNKVYRQSHALLIGINKYKNRPKSAQLAYADNDVMAIQQMLIAHYGFEKQNVVTLLDEQATFDAIRRALAALSNPRVVDPEDRVLVFFAGHGQTVKLPTGDAMGFLIPYDADALDPDHPDDPTPYQSSCLPMDFLWTQLKSSPAKHTLLLADACYSGLLAQSPRADEMTPQTLAEWSRKRAMEVITGGSSGETTVELTDVHHGAFSHQLLEELGLRARSAGSVFTASNLFASLQVSVPRLVSVASEGRKVQTPLMGKHLGFDGEFLFIPTGKPIAGGNGGGMPEPVTVTELGTQAELVISSEPSGATVTIDDEERGKTPLKVTLELGIKAKRTVQVGIGGLLGYKDQLFTVDALRGKSVTVPPRHLTAVAGTPVVRNLEKYGLDLVEIPAGEFTMGSNDYDGEKPVHQVYLDTYFIAKNVVTVKQYLAFCAASGHARPTEPSWGWKENHPIVNVSWNDATDYCVWLSHETGLQVSLPTEAQWEKASRGGDGRKYPWGNEWDGSKCANSVGANSLKSTMPVGSYASGASPYGVLDMAGNVWQWCSDWYDANYYRTSPDRNSSGPATSPDGYRVRRGGSWGSNNPNLIRCAKRARGTPNGSGDSLGFRCVVSARP